MSKLPTLNNMVGTLNLVVFNMPAVVVVLSFEWPASPHSRIGMIGMHGMQIGSNFI